MAFSEKFVYLHDKQYKIGANEAYFHRNSKFQG